MTGGAQNRLKGAHFGVWVGGRPVSGLGTWEGPGRSRQGDSSGQALMTILGFRSRHLGGRGFCRGTVRALGRERLLPCPKVVGQSLRP